MTTRRIRVGVLLGGASGEREISLASGKMIADHLPSDRYEVVLFDTLALMASNPRLTPALREKARALLECGPVSAETSAERRELPASLQQEIAEAERNAVPATEAMQPTHEGRRIDVAFLALHGPYGEDGTLQGMLELVGIPYVGSGVLASALAMDKAMAKKVLAADGLPVARGVLVEHDSLDEPRLAAARSLIPAIVKPNREGSSLGMSLVDEPQALVPALEQAFRHDPRVLVEERLQGRELTVGVIGNARPTALPVVEIVPRRAFFDYRAKYDPAMSDEICPAHLPEEQTHAVQQLAIRAHAALDCRGLSRVDMILTPDRGPILLELNTLPGMTVNSLLPKAARAAGIPFGELLDRLIQLALGRESAS